MQGLPSILLSLWLCITLFSACLDTDSAQEAAETAPVILEEVLRLGDESAGDTILFGPMGQIAVNGRGEIIVAENNPLSVRAFGADGTFLGAVGARGQGPGEYLYLSSAVIGAADSVYLWEFVADRVLVYDPDDYSYVRSVEVENDGEKQISSLIGAIENGWLMVMSLPPFLRSDDGSWTINSDHHFELKKVNRDGTYGTDLLGTVPRTEMIYNIQDGGGLNFVNVPFARSPTRTVGPDDMLYYGWSDAIEITVVAADGSRSEIISYEHDPVPVTNAEMDEAEAQSENELFRQLLAAREPHTTKPAFQAFVVDETGRVWIKLSSPEGAAEAEWLILDRESQLVGKATLPAAVTLDVVRSGHAYGRHQERGGAPMIVVYEIQE